MKLNTIWILAIFLLPLAIYTALDFKHNASSVSVAESVKPRMVMITSTMCGECVKMKKVLDQIQPSYQNDVTFERYDANQPGAKPYIEKYNITLVPTMMFFKKDGKLNKKIEGSIPQATLEGYLKELK